MECITIYSVFFCDKYLSTWVILAKLFSGNALFVCISPNPFASWFQGVFRNNGRVGKYGMSSSCVGLPESLSGPARAVWHSKARVMSQIISQWASWRRCPMYLVRPCPLWRLAVGETVWTKLVLGKLESEGTLEGLYRIEEERSPCDPYSGMSVSQLCKQVDWVSGELLVIFPWKKSGVREETSLVTEKVQLIQCRSQGEDIDLKKIKLICVAIISWSERSRMVRSDSLAGSEFMVRRTFTGCRTYQYWMAGATPWVTPRQGRVAFPRTGKSWQPLQVQPDSQWTGGVSPDLRTAQEENPSSWV